MKINQVGIQLYTLREFTKTPQDVAKTMKKVRQIGYEAVQVSGMGPIEEAELMKILNGEGLVCAATHENSNQILNAPQAVVERLKKLNCKYTAYPYPADQDLKSMEGVLTLAKKLEHAGKVLHDAGLVLTYHNHHIEFLKINGKPILEWIYEKTNPQYLQGEPDTYWIQTGGASPLEWCQKLKNRLPLLHLKDYKITGDIKPDLCEIGNGNINFKPIIKAAEENGCVWYFVEQDTCPGDPFDSIKFSYNYIKEHLCI